MIENVLKDKQHLNVVIPEGSTVVTLGDIVEPSKERVDINDMDCLVYVGLEHIEKNTGKILSYGNPEGIRSIKSKFYTGDLLYGKLRPNLNKVWLADREGICSTDILVFPRSNSVLNKFLLYRLLSYDFVTYASQHVSGVELPRISFKTIAKFPVILPPLSEQHRIVTKIEELFTQLDAGVAALTMALTQLKRYRQSVLKAAIEGSLTDSWRFENSNIEPVDELMDRVNSRNSSKKRRLKEQANEDAGDSLTIPDSWKWVQVQDVGEVKLGRQRAPQHHQGQHMRPYLRVANVYEDRIDTSDILEMNFSPEEYETYRLQYGDILLNEGQSKELVGRPAMFRNEVPGACFQNTLVRFRAYDGILPEYALIVFRAYLHTGKFLRIARWTTNIAHLGAQRFALLTFPLPPLAEQREIVSEIERRFSIIDEMESTIQKSLKQAGRLRQSILKRAFEGKLVPQDPDDEPASLLLERIKREKVAREAAAKAQKTKRSGKITYAQQRLI